MQDPDCYACGYCDSAMAAYPTVMLSGLVAAVACAAVNALTAIPVSTVHAVVGGAQRLLLMRRCGLHTSTRTHTGVVGASYIYAGHACIHWSLGSRGVLLLLLFWLLAPIVAGAGLFGNSLLEQRPPFTTGVLGAVVFWVLRHAIMSHDDPMGMAAFIVPLCAGISAMFMALSMSGTVPGYKTLAPLWKALVGMGAALVAVVGMGCASFLCSVMDNRMIPTFLLQVLPSRV